MANGNKFKKHAKTLDAARALRRAKGLKAELRESYFIESDLTYLTAITRRRQKIAWAAYDFHPLSRHKRREAPDLEKAQKARSIDLEEGRRRLALRSDQKLELLGLESDEVYSILRHKLDTLQRV